MTSKYRSCVIFRRAIEEQRCDRKGSSASSNAVTCQRCESVISSQCRNSLSKRYRSESARNSVCRSLTRRPYSMRTCEMRNPPNAKTTDMAELNHLNLLIPRHGINRNNQTLTINEVSLRNKRKQFQLDRAKT